MFKPIKIVIDGIDKLSQKLEAPMKKLEGVGKAVGRLGRTLTVGVSLPILAAGFASVKFAEDLNKGMANVSTLIPGNTARVLELKGAVQDLSLSMGKASTEISGGLYQVISTFGDAADTVKILEINTKMARAGLSTVSEAINFTGAITKAYGDTSAAAMQKVADLGFKTVELGVTTFPELAGAIGRVTPLAETMGVKMEEMFGVMATATGVTGNTAEVATQLSSILTAMIKPTDSLQGLFEALGYKSGQAMIKDLGFAKSLQTVVGMANKAEVSIGDLLGRKEALNLALALTGKQADTFSRKLDAMTKVSGTLDRAFKAQTTGVGELSFTMDQARARIVKIAQDFGDKLAPAIMLVLNRVEPLLIKFTEMKPQAMTTILVIGGIVAAIGPMLLVFSGAISLVTQFNAVLKQVPAIAKLASFSIKLLGGALKFMFANPIGLTILAVGLLIYNIILLRKNWDSIISAFSSKFMILQTLNFFMADIAKSIGNILSYIPGLGKLANFFNLAGKGFELKAADFAKEKFGTGQPSPAFAGEKYGFKGGTTASKSEVLVKFDNMPKGTRVDRITGDIDLETITGSALAGVF